MKEKTMNNNSMGRITLKPEELGAIEIMEGEMNLFFPTVITSEKMWEIINQMIEEEKERYLEANGIKDRSWSEYGICVYSQVLHVSVKNGKFEYFLHFFFTDTVDASLCSKVTRILTYTEEQKADLKTGILQAIGKNFGF